MPFVADYSAGFPGAAELKRAGFIGAVRYIGTPGNIKCATAAELRDFVSNGLGMALVFEQTAGQWRNGYSQGQRDAVAARSHASAIGFPLNRPIYFAIDQDVVTEDEFRAMDSYADGWASVLGHDLCGPYGEHDVVARCWSRGFAWAWQCRAWSGIPSARMFEERHLFQRVGTVDAGPVQCDVNDVNKKDWGQYPAPNGRNAEMTLMKGPGAPVYVVDASGKRHITSGEEASAHVAAGAVVQNVSQATLDAIPDVNVWNAGLPTTDSDEPAEFRPAHRLMAALYEGRHDGTTSVTMTEADRTAIAEKVRLGLLDDLAPLFELAQRLES